MVLTLQDYLDGWAGDDVRRHEVATAIAAIAGAAINIADMVAMGPLLVDRSNVVGGNIGGDKQTALDLRADGLLLDALKGLRVAAFASEEQDAPVDLDPTASIGIAVDPLDGSSNIDTNVSMGTIFSIVPMATQATDRSLAPFLQPGSRQLAAGFVVYGPHTALVLTVRAGTQFFALDRRSGVFLLTRPDARIPEGRAEYAINASNQRHWSEPIRAYVGACVAGVEGPHGRDFNMRWIASLVAEAFRILTRGGVFLYPGDARPSYEQGRLRLVYEANPLALLFIDAGGAATDGSAPILDLQPTDLHQRVPLVLGSRDKVARVAAYVTGTLPVGA